MSSGSKSTLSGILKTSIPAVLDLSSQTLTWLIEAIFIGHLSAAALAGVGVALQVIILTFTIILTFVVGASVIIIRYLGNDDHWNANHVLAQALFMGIVLSFIIGIVWYFGSPYIFAIIKEEEPVARRFGIQYLQFIAFFAPFLITNFIALGIMRMAGDTLLTMKVNLFANILNIAISPFLIFGWWIFPRLETRGAAMAVCIAHTLAFFYTLYYLRSRKSVLFLSFRELTTLNLDTFKRLFKLGIPTTVEQLAWAIGQLILSFFAARMGIVVLATHQVYIRVQSVLSMVYQGFGIAGMTAVGKNLGAARQKQAVSAGNTASRVVLVVAFTIAVLIFVFGRGIMAIFTNNENVINYGASLILVLALLQIPKGVNIVFSSNLRGGADLRWLMWLAISSVLLFETLGSYSLAFWLKLSLEGLWLIQILDESFRLTLNYFRFRSDKWSRNEVV